MCSCSHERERETREYTFNLISIPYLSKGARLIEIHTTTRLWSPCSQPSIGSGIMLIIRMKFSRCVKLGTKRDPHSWAADVRSQYVGVVFSSECCLLSSTAFWSNYWPELLPSDSVPCPNISMIKWVVQDRTLSYNRIEKIEIPSIEVDVAQLCL